MNFHCLLTPLVNQHALKVYNRVLLVLKIMPTANRAKPELTSDRKQSSISRV
jgi:hypothetical protein